MFSQAMPITMSSSLLQSRGDFPNHSYPNESVWFHNIASRLEPFDTKTFGKKNWESHVSRWNNFRFWTDKMVQIRDHIMMVDLHSNQTWIEFEQKYAPDRYDTLDSIWPHDELKKKWKIRIVQLLPIKMQIEEVQFKKFFCVIFSWS